MRMICRRGHAPDTLVALAMLMILLAILIPAGARVYQLAEAKRAAGAVLRKPEVMHLLGGGIGVFLLGLLTVVAFALAYVLVAQLVTFLWERLQSACADLQQSWEDRAQ